MHSRNLFGEQALAAAVTCTILAAASPQRSRVLGTLHKLIRSFKNREKLDCLSGQLFPFRNL